MKALVESHEKRLNAINGSLERVADRLDELVVTVEQGAAVAKARADTAASLASRATRSAVDRRTFILTFVGCSAAVASVIIAALALGLGH